MRNRLLCIGVMATTLLSACGDPTNKVAVAGGVHAGFKELEDARGTARDNSLWNAQKWRADSPLVRPDWDILARGDSTQDNACPQGDGWASVDMVSKDKTQTVKIKCSTVSANIGCLEATDFKSKTFAQDEGHCQPLEKVPYPLPKIAN